MSFSGDELNFLINLYMQESGFEHSAYIFRIESQNFQPKINRSLVPEGALISIVQKGIDYTEAEICVGEDGSEKCLTNKLSLLDAVTPEIVASLQSQNQRKQNEAENEIKKTNGKKGLSTVTSAITSIEKMELDSNIDKQNEAENEIKKTNGKKGLSTVTSAITSIEKMELNSNIDKPNNECIILKGHKSDVFICAWNQNTDLFATGSGDGTARIWDVAKSSGGRSHSVLKHFVKKRGTEVPINKEVTTIDWKCDGTLLATGSYDGCARIWTADGKISRVLAQHKGPIFALKWNKKGNYILSAGVDKTAMVWDVASAQIKQQFTFHEGPTLEVDWRSDCEFASCSTDTNIHVCQLGVKWPIQSFIGHTNEINAIKWDPQGNLLASCSDDMSLKIWSMKQNTSVCDLHSHTKEVYTIQWSPSGPSTANPNMNLLLASASFDSTVRLWDLERSSPMYTLDKHTKPVYSVAYSPNGKLLASGSLDNYVHIWSTQSGELVQSYKATGGIYEVCWNSRGDKIGAGSDDGSAFILDIRKF